MVQYKYDAWGNHAALYWNKVNDKEQYSEVDVAAFDENYAHNKTLAELNPFRYRGYYYDTETGLYYLKTRYYDPEVGRFITIDDLSYLDPDTINGLNLYAYCGNNPVMRTDSQGANWWTDFWDSLAGKIVAWVGVAILTIGAVVGVIVGTFFTGGLLGAVIAGAGFGVLSGFAYSIEQQGGLRNIANMNPATILLSGVVGGVLGAATGAFSYGVSVAGEILGETIGVAIGNSSFLGLKISKVVDDLLITNIGKVAGRVLSGALADVFSSYAVNKFFGLTFGDNYFLELLGTQGMGWLSQFIQYMAKGI